MCILIRLAHQFAAGEDAVLSQPATVDLLQLLDRFNVVAVEERSLTANQQATALPRRHGVRAGCLWRRVVVLDAFLTLSRSSCLQWASSTGDTPIRRVVVSDLKELSVTLQPMQIRTFAATVSA